MAAGVYEVASSEADYELYQALMADVAEAQTEDARVFGMEAYRSRRNGVRAAGAFAMAAALHGEMPTPVADKPIDDRIL